MTLRIRTTTGKPFRRCGLVFTGDWTEVTAETLGQRFASPGPIKKGREQSYPIIGDILRADPMLVCVPVTPAAGDEAPTRNVTDDTPLSELLATDIVDALGKADVKTVGQARTLIANGTLGDVEGIGAGRAKSITAAVKPSKA